MEFIKHDHEVTVFQQYLAVDVLHSSCVCHASQVGGRETVQLVMHVRSYGYSAGPSRPG